MTRSISLIEYTLWSSTQYSLGDLQERVVVGAEDFVMGRPRRAHSGIVCLLLYPSLFQMHALT